MSSHGRFDQTLDKLIQQQTQFIGGVTPPGGLNVQSSTVPLTEQFRPTLDEALTGGFRADTGAARRTATEASNLTLRDTLASINESLAAKGLTGSSAQSQQGLTAGVDLATLLGERLASLELGADEAAAGRRVQGLQSALGEASAAQATRGLDLQQAGLDLTGRTQQAGAGQSLIDTLLANNPQLAPPTPLASRNVLASRPSPIGTARGFDRSPLTRRNSLFPPARRVGAFSPQGIGFNPLADRRNRERGEAIRFNRFRDLASIFGQGPGAGVASAELGAGAKIFS